MENLKWIFFDLDDTIWDFAANSEISLELLYKAEPVLQNLFGEFEKFSDAYHALNSALWRRYHHAEISREYLLNERFRGILADALDARGEWRGDKNGSKNIKGDDLAGENIKVDNLAGENIKGDNIGGVDIDGVDIKVLAERLNWQYLNALGKQGAVVDGAREVLEVLSKKYLIGVLSNGFREVQYDKLRNTGLDRFVQRTVLSDEIGIQKPDRRIFDYALAETGATAENVLMVGDNPETDVAGSISAGWRAVYFDRFDKGDRPEGALSISDLRELINLF